jgi:hypothetical protein
VESSVGHFLSQSPRKLNEEAGVAGIEQPSKSHDLNRDMSDRPITKGGLNSKKRANAVAFGPASAHETDHLLRDNVASSSKNKQYFTPPFMTSGARMLIQKELKNATRLNDKKRDVFQSALMSLHKNSDKNQNDEYSNDAIQDYKSKDLLRKPSIPPASLIRWIIKGTGFNLPPESSQQKLSKLADNMRQKPIVAIIPSPSLKIYLCYLGKRYLDYQDGFLTLVTLGKILQV